MKTEFNTNGGIVFDFNNEKKLKGYQFDSLVYRYIRAREQMAEYCYYKDKRHDKEYYYNQAQRDILRFCEILSETIGEHE